MENLFSAYRALITSPVQLELCRKAESVPELLALLKVLLQQEALGDEQFIGQLQACNQQTLALSGDELARSWIPYRYDARSRSIFWCLPDGRATEPFHDEFISRCRQRVLPNQFLAPKTHLPQTDESATKAFQPAGFIFHLSRCGSTLVSGSFAEIECASVLSESPLLTGFLLDPHLSDAEKQQWLPNLIRWQGEGGKTTPPNILVKWNAWDIFYWPIIRKLYPQTPVLLLVRNPQEILASHQRQSGRHMASDPSMAHVHPVFNSVGASLLDFRTNVLGALQQSMLDVAADPGVAVMDYRQLNAEGIQWICRHFGILPTDGELNRIRQRMQRHSKEPERQFQPDSQQKQQVFDQTQQAGIRRRLQPVYQQLLAAGLANA